MQECKANSVDNIIATVCIVNSVKGKVQELWHDTCVIIRMCYDRSLFKIYHEVDDEHIQMKIKFS